MSSFSARVHRLGARVSEPVGDAVERRVRTVRARREAARYAEDVRALSFRHGYLVRRPGSTLPDAVAGWPRHEIAGFIYHLHPSTRLAVAAGQVVLLGDPVDVDSGTTSPEALADRLLEAHGASPDEAVRLASYLGGRWTLLLHSGHGSVTVMPDALASQDVWWDPDDGTIGSHEALVSHGTVLRPNSLLTVSSPSGDAGGVATQVQPHSSGQRTVLNLGAEAAFSTFRGRLVAHTRLLTSLGRPGVALTGGPASQAVLAAYLEHPRADGYTFTTFSPASARRSLDPAVDLFTASQLAHAVGIPHRVLEVPPGVGGGTARGGQPMAEAYRGSYPSGQRPGVALAHASLPVGTVQLHSAGADIVDLETWDDAAGRRAGLGFPEGDLAHRVLLPFNDRRLLELMLAMAAHPDPGAGLVARMADELPPLPIPLDELHERG